MLKVRTLTPKEGKEVGVGQAMRPFTHSMEDIFENFLPRRWMEGFMEPFGMRRMRWPELESDFDQPSLSIDLIDRDHDLLVRAELPGIDKDEVEITVAGDYLTIEAKRETRDEEKKKTFYRSELGYGRMIRTIYLPAEIDAEKVKAELKNGILEIKLPKIREIKRHTVKVA